MDSSSVILIVDASKFMRDYIHKSLKNKGYNNIIEAVDGKNALDTLMEYKVDLVISELNMPKVNGLELIKALSNHSELKHIPVMVIKSDDSIEMFEQSLKFGVKDYIEKPFTPSEIDLKIKGLA